MIAKRTPDRRAVYKGLKRLVRMGRPANPVDNDLARPRRSSRRLSLVDHAYESRQRRKAAGVDKGLEADQAEGGQSTTAALERIAARAGPSSAEACPASKHGSRRKSGRGGRPWRWQKARNRVIAREPLARDFGIGKRLLRHLVAAPHVGCASRTSCSTGTRGRSSSTPPAPAVCRWADGSCARPDIVALGDSCRHRKADGGIKREPERRRRPMIDEAAGRYIAGRRGEPDKSNTAWRPQS